MSTAIQRLHEATSFYTTDPVVEQLLDVVDWPRPGRRLLEPSCGDGAVLLAALERLLRAGLEPSGALLVGYEVHAGAADTARGRIAARLLQHGWTPERSAAAARSMVLTADFITHGPRDQFQLVIGNPPFLRWLRVPEELRAAYEPVVPDVAQADLLHAFLLQCSGLLSPDGELAFVTADRWLFNQGAARLRQAIGERFSIARLERLDARTAFYRPKDRRAGTPPRVQPVAVVLRPCGPGGIPLSNRPIYPGAADIEGPTLDDVADIRLAPYLGPDGLFTVDAATAAALPPGSCVPIVDTEEIRGGQLGAIKRYAIQTQPNVEPCAEVLAHLDEQLGLIRDAVNAGAREPRCLRREPRWVPQEPFHAWDLSQERLVVPRITKRLRCVRLPAGILPTDHSVSVVGSGELSLDELQKIIESDTANAWIEARAPRLEGGYLSITTTLLRQLPVSA